ncbi:phospholipase D-like domain-containing protein [Undibacterium pigrum]|nr:phospholipase D family protein [Undibacterium pigrum]
MTKTRFLADIKSFNQDFNRCCEEYDSIDLAVAWCGDPEHTLPYKQLQKFGSTMRAIIGVSFEQTHPDGVHWLIDIGSDVRIFCSKAANIFHPKLYLFRRKNGFALFIGSSNLTYSGFYRNIEANMLIEGEINTENILLSDITQRFEEWRSNENSFVPTKRWLDAYATRYWSAIEKARSNGIETPPIDENQISTTNWLRLADWEVYFHKIHDGLLNTGRTADIYLNLLRTAKDELPLPWDVSIFREINNRRIIGGMEPFAWFGHVAASGDFRRIMANTSDVVVQATIVDAINRIAEIKMPLNWNALETQLDRLTALGPTMKVWSRLLCLIKPDVYCTVASPIVRDNMSTILEVPQKSIGNSAGYIRILKMIHSAPWFQSARPIDLDQAVIWDHRVALMDAIFYE